jgi:putative ABC transport system permease protein
VTLSVALLAAAGLLIDSVVRLGAESIGFDPNHLLSTHITLPKDRYSMESKKGQFYRTLEDRIARLPGVTGAALTSDFIVGGAPLQEVEIAGRPSSAQRRAMQFAVSNHTFGVFRIPVIRGRSFTESDGSDSEAVAIVNAAFAKQYLGNDPPLGQRIRIGDAAGQGPWLMIVGVVGNVKGAALYNEMGWIEPASVFRPLTQHPSRSLSVVIRAAGRLDGVGRLVQRQIVDVDSEIPINEPITVSARVAQRFTYPRFRALVFGAFAVLALLLSGVGLYGVLGQFVAARKQEFALRMALGASRGHIFRLVSAYGGTPLVAGFAVGIAASIVAARAIANLLYGVHPGDPLIVAATAVPLFVVAGFALVLPARRAVNVEPVAVLRDE